jgi:hypothetical protein
LGVLWEAAVVDVRLGCRDPEEDMRNEDADLDGAQRGGEIRWYNRIHEVSFVHKETRRELICKSKNMNILATGEDLLISKMITETIEKTMRPPKKFPTAADLRKRTANDSTWKTMYYLETAMWHSVRT